MPSYRDIISGVLVLAVAAIFAQSFVILPNKINDDKEKIKAKVEDKYASKGMVLGITGKHEDRIRDLEAIPRLTEKLCAQIESLQKDVVRLRTLVDRLDQKIDRM